MVEEQDVWLERENHKLPLINNWHGSTYYESKFVANPRKNWCCDNCGKTITAGPKFGFKSYSEDNNWPMTVWCIDCEENDPRVKEALAIIRSGELDA